MFVIESPSHGGADRNAKSAQVEPPAPSVALSRGRGSKPSSTGGESIVNALVALSRGRGSKPHPLRQCLEAAGRPLTGARIETEAGRLGMAGVEVALSRGRGSKLEPLVLKPEAPVSPSHGGADRNVNMGVKMAADWASPSHGGADRNTEPVSWVTAIAKSPSHGGADRNCSASPRAFSRSRSPSHGGADRNTPHAKLTMQGNCRPLTGARIETPARPSQADGRWVALSRGRGSKRERRGRARDSCCRPLTGARIETSPTCRRSPTHRGRPLTGARIETMNLPPRRAAPRVALSRGRGSKPSLRAASPQGTASPSHGGADRNVCSNRREPRAAVALSRGRGSKRKR